MQNKLLVLKEGYIIFVKVTITFSSDSALVLAYNSLCTIERSIFYLKIYS